MLTNPRIIKATTPFHVHLNEDYKNAVIPLHSITKPPSFNSNQVNDVEDNPADTIDEEIIQEHVIIDSMTKCQRLSYLFLNRDNLAEQFVDLITKLTFFLNEPFDGCKIEI